MSNPILDMHPETLRQYYSDFRAEYDRIRELQDHPKLSDYQLDAYLFMDYLSTLEYHNNILESWLRLLYVACELPAEKFLEYFEFGYTTNLNISQTQMKKDLKASQDFGIDTLREWERARLRTGA